MSQVVLDSIDEADELALTLARAREFARALGILGDSRAQSGHNLPPLPEEATTPSDATTVTSPCCAPAGDDSGMKANRPGPVHP
jgi:hypothetical protein